MIHLKKGQYLIIKKYNTLVLVKFVYATKFYQDYNSWCNQKTEHDSPLYYFDVIKSMAKRIWYQTYLRNEQTDRIKHVFSTELTTEEVIDQFNIMMKLEENIKV